ncbi:hypothetical protein GOP47_0019171 [Adiantum capillus-veneris]|uniref:Uncharacterized protein n=1 Tax=Adiantum capillus-veneris TaxID=13818 RepID=A0A9D4ZA98_ADICA|nr:hypothetical protein GOP47_0019171 [Adiantum capillus-veneris]
MLLKQVLEELSSSCSIAPPSEEGKVGGKEPPVFDKQQPLREAYSGSYAKEQQDGWGNHKDKLVRSMAAPLDTKTSAPLTRHTSTTNAQCLYKAAVTAKEIQVSSHGRLSAPALLANCLLSMISLSDDENEEATAKIEDNPSSTKDEGRSTILKSFSQLHAEERSGKNAQSHHRLQSEHHNKLQVLTCCLFPCNTKKISSQSCMGSTLELLNNTDELSSSNEDCDSRCRARAHGDGAGALRSLVKKVLCKGSREAGTGSSIGDREFVFDERWTLGTHISTQSHANLDDAGNMNADSHMYEYEYMYDNGYGDLFPVGKGGVKKSASCAPRMMDGAVAQEVVHEVMSLSHDTPVASSFVFDQSCFSPSSSTSSTTHSMKLESVHPWLVSRADLDSCTTSPPTNPPTNRVLQGVMQEDLQFRLANKRLNLSR